MSAKWFEEYRGLSQQTRFISQLSAFLIALFALLSCITILNATYHNPSVWKNLGNRILIAVISHSFIVVIFATRFVLLFFNSRKTFLLSQIAWVVCIITIFGYFTATRFFFYGSYFSPEYNNPMNSTSISFDESTDSKLFLYASNSLVNLLSVYFFISPVRRFITFWRAGFESK